ncbi:zinc finger MYM-type protein 1-like [Arctopsyche grandis]|uniref:zinc finger MYM-type protein 1-like n=1 Tax=Arctopsyche grandis TaxID=121162 RepID=UPI00406D87FA
MPRRKNIDDLTKKKRVKLSGAQYRKLRKARAIELQKQAGLNGNVEEAPGCPDADKQISSEEEEFSSLDADDDMNENLDNIQYMEYVCGHDNLGNITSISPDPGLWGSFMSFKMRDILVINGPVQIKDYEFPSNEFGRHFSSLHYRYQLLNGEKVERKWLVYSKFKNAVYCFCCKLFCKEKFGKQWPSEGFFDWKNISQALITHERAKVHVDSFRKWRELYKYLKNKQIPDIDHKYLVQQERDNFRKLVERFLGVIQFLAHQSLPYFKSSLRKTNNFLHIIDLLSKFDPYVGEYMNKTTDSFVWNKNNMNESTQRELLTIFAKTVKTCIVNLTKQAKYYSIIISCTPNKNNENQFYLILRFIVKDCETHKFVPREHFLCFLPLSKLSEVGLAKLVWAELKNVGLLIQDIRGQGYDFESFMKANQNGFQNKILKKNRKAFNVPCACHSIKEIVYNAMISIGGKVIVFFSKLRKLMNFFKQPNTLLLKKLAPNGSFANFEPHNLEAVIVVRNHIFEMIEALVQICDDKFKGTELKYEAVSLIENIYTSDFIRSAIIWHDILLKINTISIAMQSSNLNLSECLATIEENIVYFKSYRDAGIENVTKEAGEIVGEIETDNEIDTFQSEFFDIIIDLVIRILEEKHIELKKYGELFSFLHNIQNYKKSDLKELKVDCERIERALQDKTVGDVDGNDLCNEFRIFKSLSASDMPASDMLNYIYENDLDGIFPNVIIVLRIFYTLPTMLANGESCFSKLEIVRNYLQASTNGSEELAMLSIESNLANLLNLKTTIDAFIGAK